jgi:hypothetical protein
MCGNGTIVTTKVYRNSTPVVAIGYVILVISLLWLLLVVVGLFIPPKPPRDAPQGALAPFEKFFPDLGDAIRDLGRVCVLFLSLPGALLGWLLVMKKKVQKCNKCGVEVPGSLRGGKGDGHV